MNRHFQRIAILIGFITMPCLAKAGSDSTWQSPPQTEVYGLADVFYTYDFNKPETTQRQSFFYNQNRHNEFNLNLGIIKISASHQKYRSNLALLSGTYANDNYALEPGVLKNIYEANAGISLNKNNNLWLDAGIFASHIGFESAVSIDNITLTRSILAENSPYYLSGARLTWSLNKRWEIAGLICNGWQRIQKVPGNSMPSFGTQLKYVPGQKATFNWSTFIGTDDPDTSRRMRYFSNLYGQFKLSSRIGLIAGFDSGLQQQSKSSSRYHIWYSPVIIASYSLTEQWSTALRAEYYSDEKGVIITSESTNGFKTSGISLNIDYSPISNVACRVEGRLLHSKDNLYKRDNELVGNSVFITASLAIKFNKLLNNKSQEHHAVKDV